MLTALHPAARPGAGQPAAVRETPQLLARAASPCQDILQLTYYLSDGSDGGQRLLQTQGRWGGLQLRAEPAQADVAAETQAENTV